MPVRSRAGGTSAPAAANCTSSTIPIALRLFLKPAADRAQLIIVVPPSPADLQRHLDSAPTRVKRRYGTIVRHEIDDYLDVMQNLEAGIVFAADCDERINDAEVMQALRALMVIYEAEEQGQTPVLLPLAEPVQAVVDQMQEVVRMRAEQAFAIPLPVLLRCLYRILDSVTLWNKREGRRGYLDFVRDRVGVHHDGSGEPLRLTGYDPNTYQEWTPEEQAYHLANRGSNLLKAGRLVEATQVLEQAHRLEPDNASIAINLSVAYIRSARPDGAIQLLESVKPNRSDDYTALMVNLGGADLFAGREDKAFATLQRVVDLNPQIAGAPTFFSVGANVLRARRCQKGSALSQAWAKDGPRYARDPRVDRGDRIAMRHALMLLALLSVFRILDCGASSPACPAT